MLRCIAVDDEPLALKLLADNISKVPFLQLIATCEDAFAAAGVLQEKETDLVFIDIQMPGLTGLQFIESLKVRPMVIIITAYKQFALEGFSLDVIDYLIKPVPLERFMKACNKAQELFLLRNRSNNPAVRPDYMFVNAGYSMVKVLFSDIIYLEGLRDYIKIHLQSTPKPVVVRMGLKAMKEQLPPDSFMQIHKSFIVAVGRITSIRKNSLFIQDHEFFIGDTYKENVRKLIQGDGF
ncbi:MAG TPA: LytTR family DNA-binding domain-containing protein [Bacteroidales bacterium]|nr:LytTR family DNA-binding domain-containing protein [Bacteroidales bacterium]HPS73534.1 LytTR family DNA-binding domain-containing protein [Bacteroidales bacterium]